MDLSRDELLRYSRHLILPDVGLDGQQRIKAARVLLVGAGGLGSPAALYLAAAGVGTIGLVDFDVVDVSNLQRQVLHGTAAVGRPKLESARARIADLNPNVNVETYETRLTSENALEILGGYDVIVDGTDNFATRYLVNDACVLLGKPNVYGSIFRFDGQASVFCTTDGPCYRCLFPTPPPPGIGAELRRGWRARRAPGARRNDSGHRGAQADSRRRRPVDRTTAARRRARHELSNGARARATPQCPACGTREIKALIDYDEYCGTSPTTTTSTHDTRS